MTKTPNGTFWPDDLVGHEHGGLGWTPVAKALMANWFRFGLGSECFTTLIYLSGWLRGTEYTKVRFWQAPMARQQGVHRSAINRQMKKMVKAGIITFVTPGCVSLAPLMEKLREFETLRKAELAERSMTESFQAVGLLVDKGGRPLSPEQPSTARFGVPNYEDLYAEEGLEIPFNPDAPAFACKVQTSAPASHPVGAAVAQAVDSTAARAAESASIAPREDTSVPYAVHLEDERFF